MQFLSTRPRLAIAAPTPRATVRVGAMDPVLAVETFYSDQWSRRTVGSYALIGGILGGGAIAGYLLGGSVGWAIGGAAITGVAVPAAIVYLGSAK